LSTNIIYTLARTLIIELVAMTQTLILLFDDIL
jgi:hypothetical protein